MEFEKKKIRFANTLWVQYGDVRVKNEKETVVIEGVGEASYLKVFNHFGRVLKLFTFENGQWTDEDTGAPAAPLEESLAGHVPPHKAPAAKAASTNQRKTAAVPEGKTRAVKTAPKSRQARAKPAKGDAKRPAKPRAGGAAGKRKASPRPK